VSKFRVGDEVVVAYPDESSKKNASNYCYKTGTVVRLMGNRPVVTVRFAGMLKETEEFYVPELEFEAVYNSPLYKALS
jgi:ribosomal protein L35AE/L33A